MTVAFAMVIYIRIRHLSVIDEAVIGREIPKEIDSIFYAVLRITNYGGGFSCKWCAKRSKLTDKITGFDDNFKRPFQIYFWCLMVGAIIFFSGVIIQHIYFPDVSHVFNK